MLWVSAEHRIGSCNRWDKRYDEEKKNTAEETRSDAITQFVMVHGLPPRNQYWEIISRGDKGCETGINDMPIVVP
jgi:hypothetical protein